MEVNNVNNDQKDSYPQHLINVQHSNCTNNGTDANYQKAH